MNAINALIDTMPNGFNLEDLNIITPSSSDSYYIYNILKKQDLRSDNEVKDFFFPGKQNARTSFWRWKNEFLDKLANTITLLPKQNANQIQTIYFEVYRDFFIASELMARDENLAFASIAEKTIKKAIKYDITEVICGLSRKLVAQFGNIQYNKEKYSKYRKIAKKYRPIRNAEEDLEDVLTELSIHFSNSRNPRINLDREFNEALNLALNHFNQYKTLRIGTYFYIIKTLFAEINGNLYTTLGYTTEALKFLKGFGKNIPSGALINFQLKLININIRLRKFDDANKEIENALYNNNKYSSNWHKLMLYKAINFMYCEDYVGARRTVRIGLSKKKELYPTMVEDYKIIDCYLQLFQDKKKEIKLGKTFNELPIFSKDKIGNNVNILILQVLYNLRKKNYDKIIKIEESLSQYATSYLNRTTTNRAYNFIKILCLLSKSNFNSTALRRNAKKFINSLLEIDKDSLRMDIDIEKVPYEILFDRVLEFLK